MTTITRKRRPLLTVSVLALLLAVGIAGCGKDEDPSVATGNPGATGANTPAGSGQDSPLQYSQCMRDQGFSWFPDPGADGGLKVSVPDGIDQSKYKNAEEACKEYFPGSGSQPGQISEEDLNKIRQMAHCIRDRGFAKYPDPDANGSTEIDVESTGISPEDPAFQKARQDCQKYLPPRKSGGNS